jgi:hypothetical protein
MLLMEPLGELVVATAEIAPVVDHARTFLGHPPETAIELHPPHGGEIVAIRRKKRLWNRFWAASLVGGSPGRIMR